MSQSLDAFFGFVCILMLFVSPSDDSEVSKKSYYTLGVITSILYLGYWVAILTGTYIEWLPGTLILLIIIPSLLLGYYDMFKEAIRLKTLPVLVLTLGIMFTAGLTPFLLNPSLLETICR